MHQMEVYLYFEHIFWSCCGKCRSLRWKIAFFCHGKSWALLITKFANTRHYLFICISPQYIFMQCTVFLTTFPSYKGYW